ncbi:helix-turn-helix domain-containing protein [Dysgonomonas sp. BGC7]|uniref:helix-turn-helix domain-containing protein n=1 Tax=Dysgonomonas sp. BGC7 TaxID=1658008 RepID=UPI000ADA7B42|nr:helix-turn-helix domain-containing protein [Dysgonomonas sp. BGC7]MBD8389626.1 helix-turn-helix domain-containing protein [Dysgonomonas sp. BGC7]
MNTLLTNKDIMRIFSISDETIPRLRRSGLQYMKIGSEYRYKKEWIEDYIDKKSSLSLIGNKI